MIVSHIGFESTGGTCSGCIRVLELAVGEEGGVGKGEKLRKEDSIGGGNMAAA